MRDSLKEDFDALQEHDRRKSGLNSIQKQLLDSCNTILISESGWNEILKQEFYRYWIDYLERRHEELRGNPFETYLNNRNQLANLIEEHRKIVIQRIMRQTSGSIIRPSTALSTNREYKLHYNHWSALLGELTKKRHILSIRKLVEKYESIILKIAPCWLATPEAVSSIFPLKRDLFDFVIFDESSQSEVQSSITALYRGKNIVILGDEKQLPPSQWFVAREDDDENDEEYTPRSLLSDSLLALASSVFGYTYLTWHYRSSYQELIDFSNHAYYESRLKVVPNINKITKPIKWIPCKTGTWENRKNEPEAKLVVDELKHILSENKKNNLKLSVGIITFNAPQQDAIEDEIDSRREQDPEFQQLFSEAGTMSDLPFVKNIEKVQGDERDVIIISVGYTKNLKDDKDTISVNFGAINQQGGENRLNVAITRARKEIIIVCSFDPNKIKVDEKNYGSKRLRDYLCYAKSISDSKMQEVQNILSLLDKDLDQYKKNEIPSSVNTNEPLEKMVQSKLQELGYIAHTRVGNSDYTLDLAVIHPDIPSKYILAVECDGESFLSAASTRERDITRQDFLENKGWKLERLWSRNWWRDSDKELSRIQQKIEELRRKGKSEDDDTGLDRSMTALRTENHKQSSSLDKEPSIEELIKKGESNTMEFKASMRWDYAAGQRGANDMGQLAILKTIAAFMNSEGGTLVVGIADNGNILGIEKDFETFSDRKNWDGWTQHLVNIVRKHIGTEFLGHIGLEAIRDDGKTVARVKVEKCSKPVFVEYQDSKSGQIKVEFYYRALNTTQALNTKQASDYIKEHWKNS